MSGTMSLFRYIGSEVTRSYMLEHDQERYTSKREKMYTFMRIPRELEKFMSYGFFHCLDSFLFIYTFLPLRVVLACLALLVRSPLTYLGIIRVKQDRLLHPAEIIDLLKCGIIGSCCYAMSYVDTSMLYHMIKSQSVIKLYLMYNMIEVADRLFSAFGQDTIDALFWTATEPRGKKREHIGIIPHVLLAVGYVFLHSMLVLLQATTLNVAINASNKALLTIMMSNNFVELKGSVFKKFDKNNLFQVSCSDVRERFHLFALLFVVVVQTMKEYGWREDSFWSLAPDCLLVLGAEILVDWIKHAFITRFNEVPADVYKDYTISLAYDLAQTKQKYAFSDHSDIVSRRMGFIPLPLGVVMLRVVYTSVKSINPGAWAVVVMAYFCLLTFRILGSIVILGKACDLIDEHKNKQESEKKESDKKESDKKEADKKESNFSPPTGQSREAPPPRPAPPTPSPTQPPPASSPPSSPAQDPALFQLPSEGHQKMFLFQNSCVDRSDVLLTNMNSAMLGQGVEKVVMRQENVIQEEESQRETDGLGESGQVQNEVEEVGLTHHEVKVQKSVTVNIKEGEDRISSKQFNMASVNNSQTGHTTLLHNCNDNDLGRCGNCQQDSLDKDDGVDMVLGESRLRSLSSPDLVMEGRQRQDEWDGGEEELVRRRGEGGTE
eukprot:GFUD01002807.1.p1 GENE.GFUD01002807.1~~GFUD01002807.1.p1  ORF type:complete len:663 (+),score=231.51 GFUD01002807.1:51-2039(+)